MNYLSLAIVLACIGLVLFLAEYFLATGGLLIVVGFLVSAGAVGVVAANAEDYREIVAAVVVLCIGEPIFALTLMSIAGKRMALLAVDPDTEPESDRPEDTRVLVGRIGKTVTPLRPSGAVEFDGRRVDVVSEGIPVDVGAWVKCIEVNGTRVLVRAIDKPPDLNDFEFEELK